MSDRWVQDCERLLEKIKHLSSIENKDRLDTVRLMRFTLNALYRSILGWLGWINNPDVMAEFSIEELEEMNSTLIKFAESFIEYDAKVTGRGPRKIVQEPTRRERRKPEGFYV